jgi:hypothetical protein
MIVEIEMAVLDAVAARWQRARAHAATLHVRAAAAKSLSHALCVELRMRRTALFDQRLRNVYGRLVLKDIRSDTDK